MNAVAQLFSAADVLLDCDITDKRTLFETVARLWQQSRGVAAHDIVANLFERENLGSTGLGRGIAIPHARIDGLAQPAASFVRTRQPIGFDAPDGKPVSCFFLLLAPAEATEQHLEILAEIAEMFSDAAFRASLAAARNPEEVYHLFSIWRASVTEHAKY